MKTILAFGGGVDSTALLAAALEPAKAAWATGTDIDLIYDALDGIDAVVFSDPGAEFNRTYANVETAQALCAEAGLRFEIVHKVDPKTGERVRIQDMMLRLGAVPLMAGGGHVCSLKFKGEVLQKFAVEAYAGEQIKWLVGIEANETRRQRFQADKKSQHEFAHPLVDLGWTREDCEAVIAACWPHPVQKSSCVICPFMSQEEIEDTAKNEPEAWALAKIVEAEFAKTSKIKHQRWLDAGSPLNKGGRAPTGMWRMDSWAEGRRLFAKKMVGQQLTVAQWERNATEHLYG